MRRLTLSTLIGLVALWAVANALGVDRTKVSWNACQLSESQIEFSLRNENNVTWENFGLLARVYKGNILSASTSLFRETQPLAPQKESRIRIPLLKRLQTGETYRVEVFLQRKGSPLVRKVFDERSATQVSHFEIDKKLTVIPEPRSLREMIKPLNVRKAMGIP